MDKGNIQLLTSLLPLTQAKRGFEFLLLSRPLTKYPRKVPYLDGHSSWGLQHHVGQDEPISGCDEIGAVFEIVLNVGVDVLKAREWVIKPHCASHASSQQPHGRIVQNS